MRFSIYLNRRVFVMHNKCFDGKIRKKKSVYLLEKIPHLEIYLFVSNFFTLIHHKSKINDNLLSTVLGFNNTSILVGHFVSSPREREKRDRRDSR